MRPFTPRKRTSTTTRSTRRAAESTLQDILTGPDDAHRREIEVMLEERAR